jgi:hypothetical protein
MSSDSPGDPYQKEHKLVDKCIEKQQVHPDVVQPEIIAGSYRPLIFLFIVCCLFLITNTNIPIIIRKNPPKKITVLQGCGHLIVNPIPRDSQPAMINNIPLIIFIVFFILKSI